ncbi:hypothetical protein ACFU5O_34340 [Streptomyces sp. NPDC057445]|uniref:hypothetical protein n=1 Tax=Streptomyces sp. NPDC057445 TaxID=3346136 RepID=UPI0036996FC7
MRSNLISSAAVLITAVAALTSFGTGAAPSDEGRVRVLASDTPWPTPVAPADVRSDTPWPIGGGH